MNNKLKYFGEENPQAEKQRENEAVNLLQSVDYDLDLYKPQNAFENEKGIKGLENEKFDPDSDFKVSMKKMIMKQQLKTNIKNTKKVNLKFNRKRKRGPEPSNSALYYYRMDVLEEASQKYPNASPCDIVEMVQNQWEKLDKKSKEQYYRLAQLDKKRFDEEAKQYIPRSEGGTMKRPKRKKHPNAPKHPMSAYLYFASDHRAQVKAENPGKDFTEIAKILGDKWKNFEPEFKKEYELRAEADKARYRKEKMCFEPCPLLIESKKRKKHPLAPKHPLSGYLFFVANNRAEFNRRYPKKDFTEVAKLLGEHWKSLDAKEKRKYQILAAADKKRYEEEKQKWQPPVDRGFIVPNMPKDPSDNSFISLPKKPMTAYSFWAYSQRTKIMRSRPYIDKKELTRMLREQWNKIPDKEKEIFNEKAEQDRERYSREMDMLPRNYRESIGVASYSQIPVTKLNRSQRIANVQHEVLEWVPEDVERLLQICGLQLETAKKFVTMQITGRELVRLSASRIRSRLGVVNGEEIGRICRIISLISL